MEKILTISIAAYNVEKYIKETLDSLICPEIMDKLEIFVIDDGSKDKTKTIADEYAKKYPNSIFVISKKNGGYGSTYNTSIKLASGKYFKLLDGDDSYETKNLSRFVSYLEKIDADAVISPFYSVNDIDKSRTLRANYQLKENELYMFKDICNRDRIIAMHSIAYKTSILKEHNVLLTENCFYTDQEYLIYPLPYCNTVAYFNDVIYLYRIGLAEQSVSYAGSIKHIDDRIAVCKNLLFFFNENNGRLSKEKRLYCSEIIAHLANICIFILIIMNVNKKDCTIKRIREFNRFFKKSNKDIYKMSKSTPIRPWIIKSKKHIKLKSKITKRNLIINLLRCFNFSFAKIVSKIVRYKMDREL